jgi:S-formylglutathione hydrolase
VVAANYRMESYIVSELPEVIAGSSRRHGPPGVTGHSMGGPRRADPGLKNPGRWKSVSAFAPICSPMRCPWGEKALGGYLGPDRAAWRRYDATALLEDGARVAELLVDQGERTASSRAS